MFAGYSEHTIFNRICMQKNFMPWEEKIPKAAFRGALTGRHKDVKGNRLDRYKLLWDSLIYPDQLEINFSSYNGKIEDDDIPPEKIAGWGKIDMCSDINHKYMIIIDGNVSSWLRAPMILFSSAVPVVIESRFVPLY